MSGDKRDVEVVRLARTSTPTRLDIHVCTECGTDLMQPADQAPVDPLGERWRICLWCPNCQLEDEVEVDSAQLESFERELDLGVELLVENLDRITRARMREDVERFIDAIQRDLLLPEDF